MSDQRAKLLVLAGKATDDEAVLQALADHYQIDVYRDAIEAMKALRNGKMYQAVLADSADLAPFERLLVNERSGMVIESVGEGVCVVDAGGQMLWTNQQLKRLPEEVIDRIRQTCVSACGLFDRQTSRNAENQNKKFGFRVGEDHYHELLVTPVFNDQQNLSYVVAVVWDASMGRRLQQKIDAIDAAGRELVRLESESIAKLNVADRLRLLEEKIVHNCRDLMHFDHFIIRLINKKNNKLEPVIAVGLPPEALEVDLYAQPEGNGISGYVAVTGRSYICHDVEKDPRYVLGLDHAQSSLTVPLFLHDKVIGVFDIENQKPQAFTEDDRQFAEIFGRYVAVALNILDLLVVERYTTSGRISESVVRELTGPLNDIVTEAQTLQEMHLSEDATRDRLSSILVNVELIRKAVKNVTHGPQMVLGAADFKQEQAGSPLTGKRILVADDEEGIRNTVNDVLCSMGCIVSTAKDGHEACRIIAEQDLDLVLSDIRLPHRNGYEIFAAARRSSKEMPVILMTAFGYDPNHSIVRASQEGLQTVLFKPFKVDQMFEQVYKAFGIEDEDNPPPSS
ncbi:MAG: response regulator [Phycisphaeraceae bacterium]|nr:response regulator [Phycisphaeraceae bacterium]